MPRIHNTKVILRCDTYKEWMFVNPIIEKNEIIIVKDIPWYKSWFGLKPIRLTCGIGKTFKETRFI